MKDKGVGPEPKFILPAMLALAVAGYPIVAVVPLLIDIPPRIITVPFRTVVLLLSLYAIMRYVILGRRRMRSVFWPMFLAFWLLYVARIAWDTLFVHRVMLIGPLDLWLQSLGMMFIPTVAVTMEADEAVWIRAGRWTTVAVAFAAFTASIGNLAALREGGMDAVLAGRVGTDVLSPIFYGHLGVSLVLLLLYWVFDARPGVLGWVACAVGCVGGIAVAVLSGSRGPLLALVVGGIALLAAHWARGRRLTALFVIAGCGVVLWWGVTGFGEELGLATLGRIQSALAGLADQSGQLHLRMLHDAWLQFMGSPFTGSAVVEIGSGEYPHNVVVESFMATGVLGGALFCGLLGISAVSAWRLIRSGRASVWVAVLYAQYLAFALTAGALYLSNHMWMLMGATVAAAGTATVRDSGEAQG